MVIVESISFSGATEDQLSALERRIGATLPDDYRQFLIEHNGGRPSPREFVAVDGDEGSAVHFFFTLDSNAPFYQLTKKLDVYRDRIPRKLLPIACDPFGNLVLLDLGARVRGSVYFWDHERENPDGEAGWDNMALVASSFGNFISTLA